MVTVAVGVRPLGYPTNRRQQVEFIALLCLVVPIGCRVKNPLGPINKERSAIVFKEQLRVFVLSLIWVRHTDGPPPQRTEVRLQGLKKDKMRRHKKGRIVVPVQNSDGRCSH